MGKEQPTTNSEQQTTPLREPLPFALPLHYNCVAIPDTSYVEHQIVDACNQWLIGRPELKNSEISKRRAVIFKGLVAAANKAL